MALDPEGWPKQVAQIIQIVQRPGFTTEGLPPVGMALALLCAGAGEDKEDCAGILEGALACIRENFKHFLEERPWIKH